MIRPLELALLVVAACGGSTPPAQQSPAATSTPSHVSQCSRVAEWMRSTLTRAQAQPSLAASSEVFAEGVEKAPSVDEPDLAEARDHATALFRSLEHAFATASSAEQSHDKAGAGAAVDQAGAQLEAVAAVASKLHDRCPSPKEP